LRRLYQKIYLTIIASLVLVVLVAATFWRLGPANSPLSQALDMAGELAGAALPTADAPQSLQQQAIERLAQRLGTDVALLDRNFAPIASAGRRLPIPHGGNYGGWLYGPGGAAWSFELPDGRWMVVRAPRRHRNPVIGFILFLGGITLAVAVCAYPVVRGLTQRLERLQGGVETLGAGHLSARVQVEGRDEVARLAESFNRAAARIEELVGAHRLLLANASHELRTPLSRIRLAIELMQKEGKYAADLKQDIAELDALIDEILLSSRLDAIHAPQASEDVDLLALVAEECARFDCTLDGEPLSLHGDPRLLRRMVRNLLENAERHGSPPVAVALRREGNCAVLTVTDGGPGIPASQREHVFTPFFRLSGDSKGAGLGLALVRQIARLHGGDAVVAPRAEAASSFQVSLPIRPELRGSEGSKA
jgi:signal transduction histidine kinase